MSNKREIIAETEEKAKKIVLEAVRGSLPYENTVRLLKKVAPEGDVTVFSIGKAAVPMAKAAADTLGAHIKKGLLVTKYDHTGDFSSPYFEVIEAAHPVSDENSIRAAERALETARTLTENDSVIVLLSGGGSALFEKSTVPAAVQRDITEKLLSRGAEISEINAVRRRISLVKGGKFAAACYPAKVITVALSDVLGNDKSVIASGITVKDGADDGFVREVVNKYLCDVDKKYLDAIYGQEAPVINDGGYYFAGDIDSLCDTAVKAARSEGFTPTVVSREMTGEARIRAKEIIGMIKKAAPGTALIFGGETTVTLKGDGLGGRNQEMALAAALELDGGNDGIVFISAGSDGTDGPTDAAGGCVSELSCAAMRKKGVSPEKELERNNSYHALKAAGSLLVTGATGTNVNDITIAFRPEKYQ